MREDLDTEGLQGNTAHRVKLTKIDDTGAQQIVDYDGLQGEQHTEVLRILPHGLISVPPEGSEGIIVGLGTRDMPVMIGGENQAMRPTGLPSGSGGFYDGTARVYSDGKGNVIVKGAKTLKADVEGDANVTCGGTYTLKAAKIVLDGPMEFKGNVTHTGDMATSGRHTDAAGTHKP